MASINRQKLMQGGVVGMVVLVLAFGLWYTPEGYAVRAQLVPDFQFRGVTITQYEWERPVWVMEADRASVWRSSSQLQAHGVRVTTWRYPSTLVMSAGSGMAQIDTMALRLSEVSGRYDGSDPLLFKAQHLEWSPSGARVQLQGQVMIRQGGIRVAAGKAVMNMVAHTIGLYDRPEVTVL